LETLAGGPESGETTVAVLVSAHREAPNADIAIDSPELEQIAKQLAKQRVPMLFTDRRIVFFAVDRQGLLTGVLLQLRSDALRIPRIKRGRRFVTGYVVLRIDTIELQFQVNPAENDELDVLARSQYADRA
jgi:hypothetical protein